MSYANDVSIVETRSGADNDDLTGDDDLPSNLRVSVMRLARRIRLERSTEDLSLNQLAVLGTLRRSGELTLGELAAVERVKPPSITRAVNSLVEAGLVVRRPNETDGRLVMVDLTPRARELLDEESRRRDLWLAQRLDELATADRQLLKRVAPLLDVLAAS
jgi:DNA-binding MarR family transcriptional regulator